MAEELNSGQTISPHIFTSGVTHTLPNPTFSISSDTDNLSTHFCEISQAQVQKPRFGKFLNENVQLQNFNAKQPTAVTDALSTQLQLSENPLPAQPASHIHTALTSAASVMDYQYTSTLHSRAPVFPPHLTDGQHLPRNVNNSAATANTQYLQPATAQLH